MIVACILLIKFGLDGIQLCLLMQHVGAWFHHHDKQTLLQQKGHQHHYLRLAHPQNKHTQEYIEQQ